MVRFIINGVILKAASSQANLHSNMVRFIIQFDWTGLGSLATFTFQYG